MKTETIIIRDNPNVTVTTYLHDVYPGMDSVNERPAVLILPGGGYRMCSDSEAEPIALAYMAEGFQAFVLRYSVGEDAQFPQPLQDVEEALNLIQNNALAWHVKDQQIAVVGFSAGGHLAASLATMGKVRPNAQVLLYAITEEMAPGIVPYAIPDTVRQVNKETAPAFLAAAAQDPVVPLRNSLQYAQALDNNKVPFEIHIFKDGGHGFSLAKPHVGDGNTQHESNQLASWFSLSVDWLYSLFGDFQVEAVDFSAPEVQECEEYNGDVNLLTLWENPACRKVLLTYVPAFADEEARQPALGVSLRMIEKFMPQLFGNHVLEKIEKELKTIPVNQ